VSLDWVHSTACYVALLATACYVNLLATACFVGLIAFTALLLLRGSWLRPAPGVCRVDSGLCDKHASLVALCVLTVHHGPLPVQLAHEYALRDALKRLDDEKERLMVSQPQVLPSCEQVMLPVAVMMAGIS